MSALLDQYLSDQDQQAQAKARIPPAPQPPPQAPPAAPAPAPKVSGLGLNGLVRGTPAPAMPQGYIQQALGLSSQIADFIDPFSKQASQHLAQTVSATQGAAVGLLRSPEALVGNAMDLSADAGKFIGDNIYHGLVSAGAPSKVAATVAQGMTSYSPTDPTPGHTQAANELHRLLPYAPKGASIRDVLSDRDGLGKVGNAGFNAFGADAGAATLGAVMAGPALGIEGAVDATAAAAARYSPMLAKLAPVLGEATKAGIAGFVAMDPGKGNPWVGRATNAALAAGGEVALSGLSAAARAAIRKVTNPVTAIGLNLDSIFPDVNAPGIKNIGVLPEEEAAAKAAPEVTESLTPTTTVSEATPNEAAQDAIVRTAATVRTAAARQAQADAVHAQEAQDQGAQSPDVANIPARAEQEAGGAAASPAKEGEAPPEPDAVGGGKAPEDSGRRDPLADDANAILRQAGVDFQFPLDSAPAINGFGKITVPQQVMDGLDAAGMGRAFASEERALPPTLDIAQQPVSDRLVRTVDNIKQGQEEANKEEKEAAEEAEKEKAGEGGEGGKALNEDTGAPGRDPIIFKETDEAGGSRVIGSMDRFDLHQFVLDAEHFRANPDEIATTADHPTGQWHLPLLGSQDDVGAMARALSDRIPPTPEPSNTAEALARAREQAATFTGLDPADVTRFASAIASGPGKLGDSVLTVRLMHQQAVRELDALKDHNWVMSDPAAPEVQQALQSIHNVLSIHSFMANLKYKAGLELQRWGVALDGPEAKAVGLMPGDAIKPDSIPDFDTFKNNFGKVPDDKLPPKDPVKGPGLPRTPDELDKWLKAYRVARNMDDPKVLGDFLRGQPISLDKWKYFRNSYVNFFTASIVSAPRTLIRDLWGPAIISGYNTVGRMAGGGLNVLNPLLDDVERQEAWTTSWGAAKAYASTIGDMGDAVMQAAKTVKGAFVRPVTAGGTEVGDNWLNPIGSNLGKSHGILGGHSPLDFDAQGIPTDLINAAVSQDPGLTGALPFWAGNVINKWPQIVHSMHGGVNEFAQRLSYLGEIRAQAYIEASQRGLTGNDFDAYVRQRLLFSDDRVMGGEGQATDPAAYARADRTTLTRQPTAGDPLALRTAQQVRKSIVSAVPEARFLIPIFTVPANALGEVLRRIPILNTAFAQTRHELSGDAGTFAQSDAFGRTITGAATLFAGMGLAATGALTGAGPSNPAARSTWLDTHQPYSIRVGDKYYSYQKSDIAGPMLGIIAGLYDRSVYQPDDVQNAGFAAAGALAEYFKDQASLQTVADLLNIGGDPRQTDSQMTRILGHIGSGYIPNFIQQLATQTMDPVDRVKRSPWDYIKASLPGASQTLDPVRNILGEPVHRPHSDPTNSFPVNLANANTFKNDPVLNEISRGYQTTGWSPSVITPSPAPGAHFDLRDAKAEDGYSVYDHIMAQMGKVQNDDGQTARQALEELYKSQDYADAQDGKPGKSLDQYGEEKLETREGMTEKVLSQFHTLARQAAAQESPTVAHYLAIASAKSHDSANLGHIPANQLATPAGTGLMKSLGIDIDDYIQTVKGPNAPQ